MDYFQALSAIIRPIRACNLPHTLEPMKALLTAMGSPEKSLKRVILVAGSTGKGTMAHHLALKEALKIGEFVGLYTSPHVNIFRERIMYFAADARLHTIQTDDVIAGVEVILDAAKRIDYQPSTFEATTALAMWWYAKNHIATAVLEIGLGGRFDAVNAIPHQVCVFTPIELEHAAMLGGTLESIAWHKAGIIQPGCEVFTLPQSPEVMTVLEREAAAQGTQIQPYPDADTIQHRMSLVICENRRILIDGGHTPKAGAYLIKQLNTPGLGNIRLVERRIAVVIGMLRDKDAAGYIANFDAPNVHLIYTSPGGDRALTANELAARYTPKHATQSIIPDLENALKSLIDRPETVFIVCGSLRMASRTREFFGVIPPHLLEESRRTRELFEGDSYRERLKPD